MSYGRNGGYRPVFDRMCVEFILPDGPSERISRVSYAVLQDAFGAGDDESCLRTFEMNRNQIEDLARRAISSGQVNETGGANITTDWLRSLRA